jgi:hypothetical protein
MRWRWWHAWLIWPTLFGLGILYAMLGHSLFGFPT